MPVKKKISSRVKQFLAIPIGSSCHGYPLNGEPRDAGGEKAALNAAEKYINDRRGGSSVGVYQLVKIVRPEKVPVKIEEVNKCKPCTGE